MLPATAFIIVLNILVTKAGIETIHCKRCQANISKKTSAVKFRFYRLLELVIRRFISNLVSLADILAVLPSEMVSQLQLEGATTINDIFRESGPLDKEMKWYSFPYLTILVRELGDDKCKQELEEYVPTLRKYLQSRLIVSQTSIVTKYVTLNHEDTQEEYTNSNVSPVIAVLVDPEWDKMLVGPASCKQERAYIASLLGTTRDHVQFVQTMP